MDLESPEYPAESKATSAEQDLTARFSDCVLLMVFEEIAAEPQVLFHDGCSRRAYVLQLICRRWRLLSSPLLYRQLKRSILKPGNLVRIARVVLREELLRGDCVGRWIHEIDLSGLDVQLTRVEGLDSLISILANAGSLKSFTYARNTPIPTCVLTSLARTASGSLRSLSCALGPGIIALHQVNRLKNLRRLQLFSVNIPDALDDIPGLHLPFLRDLSCSSNLAVSSSEYVHCLSRSRFPCLEQFELGILCQAADAALLEAFFHAHDELRSVVLLIALSRVACEIILPHIETVHLNVNLVDLSHSEHISLASKLHPEVRTLSIEGAMDLDGWWPVLDQFVSETVAPGLQEIHVIAEADPEIEADLVPDYDERVENEGIPINFHWETCDFSSLRSNFAGRLIPRAVRLAKRGIRVFDAYRGSPVQDPGAASESLLQQRDAQNKLIRDMSWS